MKDQFPKKHHYVPSFYLSRWSSVDGKICEYSRPFKDVVARKTYPTATGFEVDLYTTPWLPEGDAYGVETEFFRQIDQEASDALQLIVNDNISALNDVHRRAWARFVIATERRTPEKLQSFRETAGILYEEFLTKKAPDDPRKSIYSKFSDRIPKHFGDSISFEVMKQTINSHNVIERLINMRWGVVSFRSFRYPLLTSDRPLIMPAGIINSESYVVFAISLTILFIATNNIACEDRLRLEEPGVLMEMTNDTVVRQATKYVFGTDDSQLRFISNRLRYFPN